ncbi:MAG TPA: thioesterase family protein [Ktedonobacteraceae bacterium]|nr:thioesterase family protein [Ktedonobacteraceae bacterium]
MPDPILTARSVVYPWHCDHMGHMNVMWYVGKFDDATWHLFALLGLTPTFFREHQRGMAAVQQEITYRRELHAGDVVTIYSSVLEVREKVIRFSHEMRNEETGEVAAVTTITGVYLDAQIRKSCPLPPAVIERARSLSQANISGE